MRILNIIEGNYDIIESYNQFVDGEILYNSSNYDSVTERIFTSPTDLYYVYKFSGKDNPMKVYELDYIKNSDNAIIHVSASYVKAKHFLEFFRGNKYFEVKIDESNKYIIFNINPK